MAVGNSGSFIISGTKQMCAICYWSETYNADNNTHILSIDRVELESDNWYGFTYYLAGNIYVDGLSVISMDSRIPTHRCSVYTQYDGYEIEGVNGYAGAPWTSLNLLGNSDGSLSISISFDLTGYTSDGSGASGFNISGSKTVALYTISQKSTASMPTTTMGIEATITVNRKSSSFTHTIAYSFGDTSGIIAEKTTASSLTWTPPISLAEQLPNSTAGTGTLVCSTYNGNSFVGSSTSSFTLTVPASVIPTIGTTTVGRINGTVPTSWGIYVKNKSKAYIAMSNVQGAYGSTITAYSITGGGYSSTSKSMTTGFLKDSGNVTFTAKAMDSRGRWSAEKSVTITVYDYSPPSFQRYSTIRCTDSGTVSSNGTYAKGNVSLSYASCNSKNSITTAVEYKKASDSDYTSTGVSFSADTDFVFGGGELQTDYTYTIRYTITDAFGSVCVEDTVSTASVVMDFKSGGMGVAVGKVSETNNCFEVSEDWDVKVYGMLLEAYIRSLAPKDIVFAECDTAADVQDKIATTSDTFTLQKGSVVAVKFTYSNSVAQPRMNINGTGVKYITGYANYVPATYAWKPGQTVFFIFDGSFYAGIAISTATTGYWGITVLSNSVSSTAQDRSATPYAVKQAYDRSSWDSISLTNPLALAYGGTGAADAATARSNLGIYATLLYYGTMTTGSCSVYTGYKFYVVIGQTTSSSSRCTVVIPASIISSTSMPFQFADESYYYSFNVYLANSAVYFSYRARGSSGQITHIYGIN